MGIIAKQSIKGSIYSYLGSVIGFINVGLLMPTFFSKEQVGLVNLLIAISVIISQIGTLGFQSVITRMFPYFKDEKNKHNGFFTLLLMVGLVGFIITVILYYTNKAYLIETSLEKSALFSQYAYLLLPLFFINIYFILLDTYTSALFNASIGIFFKEFILRILNLVGILLFYFDFFDFFTFLIYYIVVYSFPIFGILIYLFKIGEIQFSVPRISKSLKKESFLVAFYGLIAGFSSLSVLHIDKYMVNHYCGLSDTGVYSVMVSFATYIAIAGRSISRISGPMISNAYKNNDVDTIQTIYKKSVSTQLLISTFLFTNIWINIDNILRILPEYAAGKWAVFIIGLAFVIMMAGGVSIDIIRNTSGYKFVSYLMIVFVTSIVLFNLWLIPIYGMLGAAFGSLLAYSINVFIRVAYVYYKYKVIPYNLKMLVIVVLSGALILSLSFLPEIKFLIPDIMVRSGIASLIFLIVAKATNVSEDFNAIYDKVIARFLHRKQ